MPALRRVAASLHDELDGVILVHRTFQVHSDVGFGDFFLDSWGRPRRRARARDRALHLCRRNPGAAVDVRRPPGRGVFDERDLGTAPSLLGVSARWCNDGLWFHFTRPDDLEEAEYALVAQLTGPTT